MQQIADWLKKLGMPEYTKKFAEERIKIDVLRELTDQDLDRLGIPLGHRRRMLRAIRDLGSASIAVTAPTAPVATEPARRDDAERRQLTVMFTDLVGSTALSTTRPRDRRQLRHFCIVDRQLNHPSPCHRDLRPPLRESEARIQGNGIAVNPTRMTSFIEFDELVLA